MGQLFFKGYLQDAIREGRKRTTLRRWLRPMVRVGHDAYSPGLGWLCIEAVEGINLDQLREPDAIADGFESIEAMREVLAELYPDQASDGKSWFRVHFRLRDTATPTDEQPAQPRLFEG